MSFIIKLTSKPIAIKIKLMYRPLNFTIESFQAFVVNDVELSPGPKTLLFDKHIEYIANHGNDQNDYVR